jgi:hypothetical protein
MEDSKKSRRQVRDSRLNDMREKEAKAGQRVEIDAVPAELIGAAVQAIVLTGAAIFFGSTSDGGAVKITVYDEDDKQGWFVHSSEELEWRLKSLYETYKTQ